MKKTMVVLLLSALVIGTFGAGAVSAAVNDAQTNNGFFGPMKMWDARNGEYEWQGYGPGYGPEYCTGYDSYGPYAATGELVEPEVETLDEAFEIAKDEIDVGVSKDDIYQMGRWWIVFYEDEDGVYKQARIDAFTGDVFTDYTVPAGPQAGGRFARGPGYCRAYGY